MYFIQYLNTFVNLLLSFLHLIRVFTCYTFPSKLLKFQSKFRGKKWNIESTKLDPKTFKKSRPWVIPIGWRLYFATSVSLKNWRNSAKGASRTVPRFLIPFLNSAEPATSRKNKCHGPAMARAGQGQNHRWDRHDQRWSQMMSQYGVLIAICCYFSHLKFWYWRGFVED